MTDLEAIRQYTAASDFWEFLYDRPIPWVFARDKAIVARIRARDKVRMAKAERVMQQAERALNRLPRREWKSAMIHRYLLQHDHLTTADAMAYSEASVRRFEVRAIEYLEVWEKIKAQEGR